MGLLVKKVQKLQLLQNQLLEMELAAGITSEQLFSSYADYQFATHIWT